MTILSLVRELAQKNVKLWLEGDRLRVNAPEGVLTPDLVAQLKSRKPALVAFLEEQKNTAPIAAIERQQRPDRLPLSFAQQRLWFLAQLEDTTSVYNIHGALRLEGPLDLAAFESSWQELEKRHESLRTTFAQEHGQAYQLIRPATFRLNIVDLTGVLHSERQLHIDRLARQTAGQRFDLENGPLWNVTVLRLGADEHVLLLTMHHIISDGWSLGVMTRELWALYAQRSGKKPPGSLPELPIQYVDFALWQRAWLTGSRLERQLDYWKTQLADAPPLLTLPTDRPRPPMQSHRGAEFEVVWPYSLYQGLKTLSQQHEATLFMTLHAAFSILLARYSGQDDVCIGTPIANRTMAEVEHLIGFFVNTLVLRSDLRGNPSFREYLKTSRQKTLDAYQHQAVPFELVVEALRPERSLAHSPTFQVLFALQNNQAPTHVADLRMSPIPVEATDAKFDLTLTIHEHPEKLIAVFKYSTDLFDRATIERLAGHMQTLLEGIVRNPETPVFQLPLLGTKERHQLLVEWNDTTRPYPRACFHHLFEAQVDRTPSAIAVECAGEGLSYRELDQRANHVAHELVQRGVGPDALVGICMDRSLEMMVGLLAILKAGGAYVPLDPNYPPERLAFLIANAGVNITLTHPQVRGRLPWLQQQTLIELNWRDDFTEASSSIRPKSSVSPGNLAYVIHTSGSTGTPKGVMITHRGLVNYLNWCVETYPYGQGHGVPVLASFSFDGVIPTLLGPLLVGDSVILLPEENPIESLHDGLRRSNEPYSFIKGTPTHLVALNRLLANSSGPVQTGAIILGGEALPGSAVSEWQTLAKSTRVFNQYGPTEATVACCFFEVTSGQTFPESIPIGRPLANTQVFLLDPHLQPIPIGVCGELYVAGVQLARGYLGRPDLDAERFVDNPFGSGKMYRTGDLCRWRADGNLEFLGRMDNQVKIRGFRIEIGEIEAVLRQAPHVRDAIVIVREDERGKRLVAYVVLDIDKADSGLELVRDHLRRQLPDYMIPAAFVTLAQLPLTPNGKIDRRALPAPDTQRHESAAIAPRTAIEATLLSIWQDVLRQKSIGVTDNFFQAGGDSILSIQIVARARDAGLRLTPKSLFQHQTIAELAAVVKPLGAIIAEQGLVTGDVPLTPIQCRFFTQSWDEPHHYNQSMMLALDAGVDPLRLREAIRRLIEHHDALRLRFQHIDGTWQQWLDKPSSEVPFEIVDLSAYSREEQTSQREILANRWQRSLDLSNGPLLRTALFLGHDDPRLLVLIHHLVVDGISWRILLDDLEKAYQNASLPQKTTSFKTWALRLRDQGRTIVEQEESYWEKMNALQFVRFPVDHSLGPNDHDAVEHLDVHLDRPQTTALLNKAPSAYRTQINDLLLTALTLAFRTWTGETSLRLNLEGHGREDILGPDIDISRTIGWFTSVFPVHINLSTGNVGEAIQSVKEQLGAIPGRGIGYGILRYLSGKTFAQQDDDPEVCFNYLGQFDQHNTGSLVKGLLTESTGIARSPRGPRAHLLDITGIVIDGQLQLQWSYSRNVHRRETIRQFANAFIDELQRIVDHCVKLLAANSVHEPHSIASKDHPSTLVPIRPTGTRFPIFCLPGAMGNAEYLFRLGHSLDPQQPFYALQAVGLQGEAAPLRSVEAIAAHNIATIKSVQATGPYILAGHSFGGKVAFEMARQLIKAGDQVLRVLLFDVSGPKDVSNRPEAQWDDAQWHVGLAYALASMRGQEISLTREMLVPLDPNTRLQRLLEELTRFEILPPDADVRIVRNWLELFQIGLVTPYQPPCDILVPLTLFRAEVVLTNDPIALKEREEPTLGWQPWAFGDVPVIHCPGHHGSMVVAPHVVTLAKRISTHLQELGITEKMNAQ